MLYTPHYAWWSPINNTYWFIAKDSTMTWWVIQVNKVNESLVAKHHDMSQVYKTISDLDETVSRVSHQDFRINITQDDLFNITQVEVKELGQKYF